MTICFKFFGGALLVPFVLLAQVTQKLSVAEIDNIFHLLSEKGPKYAVEAVEDLNLSPYAFGMTLRSEGKHDLAMNWSIAMIKYTTGQEKAKFFFSKAWTHFKRGEYEQAINDGSLLLKVGPSERIQANTLYMLGMIYSNQERFLEATRAFDQAEALYLKLVNIDGAYLCLLGRAEIAIVTKDLNLGYSMLEDASKYETTYGPGRMYELQSEILFPKS